MKKLILSFVFIWTGNIIFAQEKELNEIVKNQEAKYSKFIEYSDSSFLVISASEKSIAEIGNYKRAMEEYAKLHPPVPKYPLTGNAIEDEANYKILVDNWYDNNPNFPRFIQYHLFHKNLTIENDKIFYEKAVKVWFDHNQQITIDRNK